MHSPSLHIKSSDHLSKIRRKGLNPARINCEAYSNINSGALRFNNVPKPRKYSGKETAQFGLENELCHPTSPHSPLLPPMFTFQNWGARMSNSPTPSTKTNKGSCTAFLLASVPQCILLASSSPNLAIGAVRGLGHTAVSTLPCPHSSTEGNGNGIANFLLAMLAKM